MSSPRRQEIQAQIPRSEDDPANQDKIKGVSSQPRDDLISQHVFIFLGCQVAFNKEWSYQSVIQYSCPNVQFLWILRIVFPHPVRVRI
ncbi:hypothetical protein RF55_5532 [Lasius niger]|uniref:Uncharacterized protein n=1 Tax=Lasius niger TaxID=67767 RepID=A0A0J7KV15_LASNI|nr:hypothetical protein RF55_5532 [Lasius niger]